MARVSFANGLKADPGNPFVCHAWGLMEQRDGDNDRAQEIFEVWYRKRRELGGNIMFRVGFD